MNEPVGFGTARRRISLLLSGLNLLIVVVPSSRPLISRGDAVIRFPAVNTAIIPSSGDDMGQGVWIWTVRRTALARHETEVGDRLYLVLKRLDQSVTLRLVPLWNRGAKVLLRQRPPSDGGYHKVDDENENIAKDPHLTKVGIDGLFSALSFAALNLTNGRVAARSMPKAGVDALEDESSCVMPELDQGTKSSSLRAALTTM